MIASPHLLVIVGPTGTGKSELAVEIAERLDGEVVGCDALQVYRGFDIATAKPGAALRARARHHLVDHVAPSRDFNLADYVKEGDEALSAIVDRNRLPLVVGGTGMYLRGLLRGVIAAPPRRPRFRARLRGVVDRGGLPRLRRWLERLDPDSARRIPPGDAQRTVRAIEVAVESVSPLSRRLEDEGTWASRRERYVNLKIGLDMDPRILGERLDARVEGFFEAGLVGEIEALLRSGVPRAANAFKAIGYREVLEAMDQGRDPRSVVPDVQRKTRRYAKRQRTWFRKEPGVVWLDAARGALGLVADTLRAWERR